MNDEHVMNASGAATALHYRRFTAADVPAAHALSMALRWPFRAEDWQFSTDTSIAFAAEENGWSSVRRCAGSMVRTVPRSDT